MRQFKVIMTIPILEVLEMYDIDTGQIFVIRPDNESILDFNPGDIIEVKEKDMLKNIKRSKIYGYGYSYK